MKRWHGLALLVRDAVEHGSRSVEKIHLVTTGRTFALLELIPSVEKPARVVHSVHDAAISTMYGTIRVVNRAVSVVAELALSERNDRE